MFFKLLFLFSIFYNLAPVSSFTNPITLRDYYMQNGEKFKKLGSLICKFPRPKWAGVCYEVLKKLREDDMYKYKLFVNYKPFYDYDEPCQLRKFFFLSSIEMVIDSPGIMQKMLPCFGRPAVMDPNLSYEDYDYYGEIMIFPASEDSLYIYKRIPNSTDFYLLERFKEMNWINSMVINPELFALPPPYMTYGNDSDFLRSLMKMDLLAMSMDPENIINKVSTEIFFLIRTTLMKTFESEGFYVYTTEETPFRCSKKQSIRNLKLVDPDTGETFLREVQMYGCPTRSTKKLIKGIGKSYNWKIIAATTTHSVLILTQTSKGFKIKALIENLFPDYISYII